MSLLNKLAIGATLLAGCGAGKIDLRKSSYSSSYPLASAQALACPINPIWGAAYEECGLEDMADVGRKAEDDMFILLQRCNMTRQRATYVGKTPDASIDDESAPTLTTKQYTSLRLLDFSSEMKIRPELQSEACVCVESDDHNACVQVSKYPLGMNTVESARESITIRTIRGVIYDKITFKMELFRKNRPSAHAHDARYEATLEFLKNEDGRYTEVSGELDGVPTSPKFIATLIRRALYYMDRTVKPRPPEISNVAH